MSKQKAARVFIPPPLIFIGLLIVGHFLRPIMPLQFAIGDTVQPLGWSLIVLAVVIMKMAVQKFKNTGQRPEPWKPSPELIAEGIYLYTRNPMYIAMALIQVGCGLLLGNYLITSLTLLSCVLVFILAIKPEEKYLEEKFGQAYVEYKNQVRRWV